MERGSGILMHISSLPDDYGIGTFGKWAYKFADFLKASGQKYWQILPLGHTSYGDSPYQCFSAFAGNPYLIDLKTLTKEGLLFKDELKTLPKIKNPIQIDYEQLFMTRYPLLRKVYERGKERFAHDLQTFKEENDFWLEPYALYMALKETHGLRSWQTWEEPLKNCEPDVLKLKREELREEIGFWIFIQYLFYKQWNKLKSYVNALGIQIIGDMPIYVAEDSADSWWEKELFLLDHGNKPLYVAGCPPDAFSVTGQLWGNPLYDWEELERTNYKWWSLRMKQSLKLYDYIRIDHFRGFESFWAVPYEDKTAEGGTWLKGPGKKLFVQLEKDLGKLPIIAEDLGLLTKEVVALKNELGYPGMKVLQFAFSAAEDSEYLPHNHEPNCIVYTGTHDNDTTKGWLEKTGAKEEVEKAISYLGLSAKEGYHWGFIRGALSSVGKIAIIPMQDFLGLGNEARMNLPSTLGGNWLFRIQKKDLNETLANKIYQMTKGYGRCE
jgi:4-alpha-glucanotransferase